MFLFKFGHLVWCEVEWLGGHGVSFCMKQADSVNNYVAVEFRYMQHIEIANCVVPIRMSTLHIVEQKINSGVC